MFIYYLYDAMGIAGMVVHSGSVTMQNGVYYYFTKNLFGDIIGIKNVANELVASYTYNAWGECTIGANVDGIATLNPEIMLKNKPLLLVGSEHADGKLSYNDKYILWDNKSKETDVNLKDHILQFDGYIRNSGKPVAVFMVIAPSFTENSVKECVKYSFVNDTQILLITADELKEVAMAWHKLHPDESFNLGFFKQNGRFDKSLLIM